MFLEASGNKAGRTGRLEVMREVVYDTISTLRLGVVQMRGESNSKMLEIPEGCSNFQALREELEMSNTGEQLYRLRRRVALVQFYDEYTRAQADPHTFLYPGQNKELSVKTFRLTRKRKRGSSSHMDHDQVASICTMVVGIECVGPSRGVLVEVEMARDQKVLG